MKKWDWTNRRNRKVETNAIESDPVSDEANLSTPNGQKKRGQEKPETASLFLFCFFSSTFLYHYFFFNFLQSKFYSLFKILKLIAYISNNTSPVPRDSLNFSDRFNKGITLQFFESYEIVTCLVKFKFSFGRSWEESAAHVTSCLESIDMRCQETEKQKKGSEAGTNPYTNRIHNERMSLLVQCQKRKKKEIEEEKKRKTASEREREKERREIEMSWTPSVSAGKKE